jgi:LPXTG-motif cell wall-anchored protein
VLSRVRCLLPIPAVPRALLTTLVAAALAVALPAASLAQDAGSNQYQDPLAGEPGTGGGGGGGSGGGGGGGGGGGPTTAPSTNTAGTESAQADTPAGQSGDGLPATGSDTWLLALAGAALLGGGLGLRRVAERSRA